ncbi:MAG: HlyD family secretion protein [Dysgonamonadaceae bacterium]|jgi:HlyD family secretion protein|nr:HlyD family secretion protein [Dysgonamonadaceae bacterium]
MEEEKIIELRSEDFQEVLGSVPPFILRWGICIVGIICAVLLTGSAVFKYPDTISAVVTLTGTTPSAGIVARSSGKILKIYVKDNQQVQAGDYLALIENPAEVSDVLFLKNYLKQQNQYPDSISLSSLPPKQMKLGSLQSLYASYYMTLSDYIQFNHLNYYLKKIEYMKDRIRRNEDYYEQVLRQKNLIGEQLKLTRIQFTRDSTLNRKGILSQEEFERSRNQYLQGLLSLENILSTLANLQIQIAQMQEALLDTEYQYEDKKRTLETQLKSQMTQLQTEIQTWEMNYVLSSPISGEITFTNYWTENQNVTAGENIFHVIPSENTTLTGKALLPTERSGKVAVGQKVNIHFNNFPDNEFGMVRGTVQNISLVPSKGNNTNNYVIEIGLPEGLKTTYNKELPFLHEMEGQADIITEDLSVLERFFLPLKRILKEHVEQ